MRAPSPLGRTGEIRDVAQEQTSPCYISEEENGSIAASLVGAEDNVAEPTAVTVLEGKVRLLLPSLDSWVVLKRVGTWDRQSHSNTTGSFIPALPFISVWFSSRFLPLSAKGDVPADAGLEKKKKKKQQMPPRELVINGHCKPFLHCARLRWIDGLRKHCITDQG